MAYASNLYVAISDITGEELGGFTSYAKAAAAAAAFDTPARKAAFTKRQTGAAKAAGAKAAATRAAKALPAREAPVRSSAVPSSTRRGWLRATPAEAARHIAKSGAKLAIYRLV